VLLDEVVEIFGVPLIELYGFTEVGDQFPQFRRFGDIVSEFRDDGLVIDIFTEKVCPEYRVRYFFNYTFLPVKLGLTRLGDRRSSKYYKLDWLVERETASGWGRSSIV